MAATRTRRAVLALTAWTAVVAVPGLALSGTVLFWDGHDHLDRAGSGPAAVLAGDALTLFLATVLGAALALPLLVAGARLRQDGASTAGTLLGIAAGLVAPTALVGVWAVFAGIAIAGAVFFSSLAAAGGLVLVGAAGFAIERHSGGDRGGDDGRRSPPADGDATASGRRRDGGREPGDGAATDGLPWGALCWNYWLVAALVVGAVGGGLVGIPLGGAVETWDGTPQAAFDYETTETANGTRLTVTHDGGDPIPADWLRVQGDLTAVPGADRTRAGPWNGSTTRIEQAFRPGPHVAPGDRITVGVPEDCVVRVVFENRAGDTTTLGKYTCERDGTR